MHAKNNRDYCDKLNAYHQSRHIQAIIKFVCSVEINIQAFLVLNFFGVYIQSFKRYGIIKEIKMKYSSTNFSCSSKPLV